MDSIWTRTASLPRFAPLKTNLKTDVLIIGGGMAGLLCAHRLSRAGVDYALVEADRICGGTTKNTTAKLSSQHGLLYDRLIRWIWHVQIVPSWLLGFLDDLPSMLVSFGIIALGVWLVRGKRMPADEVEDFPQYRKESEGEKEEHGHGKRTA